MSRPKRVQTVETYKNWRTGAKTGIGTSAVQISSTSFKCKKGVLVKAASTNGTGLVYVGLSNVTTISTPSSCGLELAASEWIEVEAEDVTDVYVIGSTAGLSITWMIV